MTFSWILLICNVIMFVALIATIVQYRRILNRRDESEIELLDLMDRVFEELIKLDPPNRDKWNNVRIKLDTHRAEISNKPWYV